MPYKPVILLANSYKPGGRCIAGREIITGETIQFGSWVRPIDPFSPGGQGGIPLAVSALKGNGQPEIGQVVHIPLTENKGDPLQPENWIIEKEEWRLDKELTAQVKDKWSQLVESPEDLWIEDGTITDRISVRGLERRAANGVPHQSLYLISVPLLKIQLLPGWNQKMKWRASFSVGGRNYNRLSITDPSVEQIIGINQLPDQMMERELRNCYLCVSLGGEFNGQHYKLVATIITGK